MKPSDLLRKNPMYSVFKKHECEVVAHNIIAIQARTGDEFRAIEWDEYRAERLKDGHFSERERSFFEMVQPYCVSEQTARLFSSKWDI